jgi:hypothetical protein
MAACQFGLASIAGWDCRFEMKPTRSGMTSGPKRIVFQSPSRLDTKQIARRKTLRAVLQTSWPWQQLSFSLRCGIDFLATNS